MRPKDILDLIQQRPFEPFRLYLADGVRVPENLTTFFRKF